MMNRCLNDVFGYCDGEPKGYWSKEDVTAYDHEGKPYLTPVKVRLCRHDYHTCGKHLKQKELSTPTIK